MIDMNLAANKILLIVSLLAVVACGSSAVETSDSAVTVPPCAAPREVHLVMYIGDPANTCPAFDRTWLTQCGAERVTSGVAACSTVEEADCDGLHVRQELTRTADGSRADGVATVHSDKCDGTYIVLFRAEAT